MWGNFEFFAFFNFAQKWDFFLGSFEASIATVNLVVNVMARPASRDNLNEF
jgi:hypothetical protein